MERSRHRLLQVAILLLIATIAEMAEAPLGRQGITRHITGAALLLFVVTGLLLHSTLYLGHRLDRLDLLLLAPPSLIAALVAVKETGALALEPVLNLMRNERCV